MNFIRIILISIFLISCNTEINKTFDKASKELLQTIEAFKIYANSVAESIRKEGETLQENIELIGSNGHKVIMDL